MKKEFLSKKGTYKVTFALPKEAVNGAKEVVVLGDFNNWDRKGVTMSSKNGHYQTTMELNAGRYEFRYLIDQDRWENDWAADAYVASPFTGIENSVITLDTVAKKAPVKKATKAKAAVKKATAKKAATKKAAPAKKAVAKKDDLTKIEGIGPKLAKVLAEAGVETFKKLAATKAPKVAEILVAYNTRYKMYDTTTWPAQAKLAAAGKWDELKKWQDELDGGKAKK
ncbi:MAG: helix-hairpin-helix domain-containing protein [Bacteroidota bacterium]